jgi:hypothetical protein
MWSSGTAICWATASTLPRAWRQPGGLCVSRTVYEQVANKLSVDFVDIGDRRKRERKPCTGMMLHQDGSPYAWLEGAPELDLIVTLDDATSEIYSAFLVEEEGTVSTFRALVEVFTVEGLPASLYTDRGSHYFFTPTAGEAVDKERPTLQWSSSCCVMLTSCPEHIKTGSYRKGSSGHAS